MEMKGEQLVPAPQQATWTALNDPQVLKACVPGCESIDATGPNEYQVLMVARVGPVSAKFKGKLTLSDVNPPQSYSIAFEGQGGPAGFAKGGAQVRLDAVDAASTRLSYDVKANVGGKLAQIGSRLVDAAAKKVADDFFRNFNEHVAHANPGHGHGEHAQDDHDHHDDHHPAPVPPDPDLPVIGKTSLMFFAAGALVVYSVAMLVLH